MLRYAFLARGLPNPVDILLKGTEQRVEKVWIQDSKDGRLSFDLKDVLKAVGQPALTTFWTAGHVEAADDEPIFVIGDSTAIIEGLAQSGKRVSGYRLMELANGIHQTIWGEFRGYESATALVPWLIIIAFDSTWFEVHCTDTEILKSLKAKFKSTEPPTGSKAWTP